MKFQSWGRTVISDSLSYSSPQEAIGSKKSLLSVGARKSYGDSCLNDGGAVIENIHRKDVLSFQQSQQKIEVQAGISLRHLLDYIIPRGLFLPVIPGTLDITVGGAIANDIHGKNHHTSGCFGLWVESIVLYREDSSMLLSRQQNEELFKATIGGLGLTGHIESCVLKLKKIESAFICGKTIKFKGFDNFLSLAKEYQQSEYSVAWLDTSFDKANSIRGHYIVGDHASDHNFSEPRRRRFTIPKNVPKILLNKFVLKIFNRLYYFRKMRKETPFYQHYQSFFCPLDGLSEWNRLYGKSGPWQFQCVLPLDASHRAINDILKTMREKQMISFLAVLKQFGDMPSDGFMSFPRQGVTLALDFADYGEATSCFLRELYQIVLASGGRIYPAKDCLLLPDEFKEMYPEWERFIQSIDRRYNSDWWKRAGVKE